MVLVQPYPCSLDLMMESHFENDVASGPFFEADSYDTDEFRMYFFKVLPCSKRYSHDWTTCPFAHPGEKARRRDPRMCQYTAIACPEMKKDMACPRGRNCPYSHNDFEYWLHPSRYRTQLCNDGLNCRRKVCFFAHQPLELRVPACKPALPDPSADPTKFTLPAHICTDRTSFDSVSSVSLPAASQHMGSIPAASWVLAPNPSSDDAVQTAMNDMLISDQGLAAGSPNAPTLQQQMSASMDQFTHQLSSLGIASQPDMPIISLTSTPHVIRQQSPVSMPLQTTPTTLGPSAAGATALFPPQQSSRAPRLGFLQVSSAASVRRNSLTMPLTIPENGPLSKPHEYAPSATSLAYQSSLYTPTTTQMNMSRATHDLDAASMLPVAPSLHAQQLASLSYAQQPRRSLDSTTQLLAQQNQLLAAAQQEPEHEGQYGYARHSFDIHQLRAMQDAMQYPSNTLLQQQQLEAPSMNVMVPEASSGMFSFEAQQQHQQQRMMMDKPFLLRRGPKAHRLQQHGAMFVGGHSPTELSHGSDTYQLLSMH